MNKTYRLVWNEITNTWTAVAEIVKARGKRNGGTLLLAACGLLGSASALAQTTPAVTQLPTGGRLAAGQASIHQNAATMNINQASARAVIDWQSFNVGSQAQVNFQQPSSSAVILNRVLSSNPSQIFGQINANGQVFLSNPAGIYFSPSASVNVGALVATTHAIGNEEFMAGNYRFTRNAANGQIVNEGRLTAALGGYIALLAPEVRNQGVIFAELGTVALAAGEVYELQFSGNNTLANLQVEAATITTLVENGQAVHAPGGLIILSARAADRLQGSVVRNSGTLEASSLAERGGKIVLTGDHITLAGGSQTNATGATGGGEVLVGGGWQGSGGLYQATTIDMDPSAKIDVSATQSGNGGTAVLWTDVHDPASQTRAYGTIWAKGGAEGGNGGRIETSGHWLDVSGIQASANASHGSAGVWLLDPYNVTIGSSASGTAYASAFTPKVDSFILASDIANSLQNGTSVTITTGSSGTSIGDITVSSAITKGSGNTDVTLTLQAANSIVVDQAISNTGGSGKLHVVLDADNNNGIRDGGGIILLNNDISTGGGNLSFGTGATLSLNGVSTKVGGDVYVAGSGARSITTGGGNVTVNGEMIIANTSGLTINTTNGNVTFGGQINSGNTYTGVSYSANWANALSNAQSGTGSAAGDTYLATITSRLENALASRAVNYNESWLGARRVTGIGTNAQWRWVTGPEAAADGAKGTVFFTQTGNGTGTTSNGLYSNWSLNEPNNYSGSTGSTDYTKEYESVLQFTGNLGQWNDLTGGPNPYANTPQTLNYYVKETNLAASPLTINAGSGTVTFAGAVGANKPLAALNVTAATTAINGGNITTNGSGSGSQIYSGNITLGSASTTLNMLDTPTNFVLGSGNTLTNATGADASLTIKTTANIILDTNSAISSTTGKLNTLLWSDSDANGGGIHIKPGASISSNGGNVVLSGGADYNTGYAKGTAEIGTNLPSSGFYSGVLLEGSIVTQGGDVLMRGQAGAVPNGYGAAKGVGGVYIKSKGSVSAGSGAITAYGYTATDVGPNNFIRSVWLEGSLTSTSGAISITGETIPNQAGSGILLGGTTISSGSGNINLKGEQGSGEADILTAGTNLVSSSSGNIVLELNDFSVLTAGTSFSGGGNLTIKPRTAGTTIGIGGAGTLQLASTYFNIGTNLANGFSGITIGSANAGDITIAGSTTYNDPLTFKTASSIFMNGGASLTGAAAGSDGIKSSLVMWADANANQDGAISLKNSTAITTNGGNIVLGGGADPTTTAAYGNSTTPDGILLFDSANPWANTPAATINAGGGNIRLTGQGWGSGHGINSNVAANIQTSGAGNISLTGTGGISGYGVVIDRTTLQTVDGDITVLATAGASSAYSLSQFVLPGGVVATGSGNILITGIGKPMVFGDTNLGGNTATGSIVLLADDIQFNSIGINTNINTSGSVTLQPYGASFSSALNTGRLNLNSRIGGVTLGKSGNITDITIANAVTIAGPISIYGGNIAINAALTATGANTISLTGSGNITQTAALSADKLALLGGHVTLDNTSNNVNTLAAIGVSGLAYTDSNALTIGVVNPTGISATGPVRVETLTGDLSVTENIATTDTSADAMILNAGKSAAAGTATGGNIVVTSGKTVTVGDGGTAKLYTGSVSGSTNLAAMAGLGSGSGRFRYNADETTNFTTGGWTNLNTGLNAIYREQPTLSILPSTATSIYGDAVSVAGVTSTVTGYINGDDATKAGLSGSASFTTTAASSSNAGTYNIAYASGLSNSIGYAISDNTNVTNEYSITKRTVTLSASKTYDGTTVLSGTQVTIGNTVGTQTLSYTGATASDAHVATANKYINAITLADGSNDGLASNYQLPTLNVTNAPVTITPAQLTATASITAAAKTYDGLLVATGSTVTGDLTGELNGDSITLDTSGVSLAFNDAHVATANKTIGASGTVALGTLTAGGTGTKNGTTGNAVAGQLTDYTLAAQPTITAVAGTINSKSLSVTAPTITGTTKTYDGLLAASGSSLTGGLVSGFVGADSGSLNLSGISLAYNSAHVASATTISASGSATLSFTGTAQGSGNGSAGNAVAGLTSDYSFAAPTINSVAGTITPRPITITANSGQSKVYGDADPTLAYTPEANSAGRGLVGTDTFSGALARAAGETVGSAYAINQGTLANSNYAISFTPDNFAITQRPITLAANTVSKTYGETDPALGVSITSGSLGSVSVSDTLADLTGTLSRQSGENVGSYDVALGAGSKASNYAISFEADNNALSITPAALTVTANSRSKSFGETIIFSGTEFTSVGLQNGEAIGTVSLLSLGAAATANLAGSPYAIRANAATGDSFSPSNYVITYVDGLLTVTPPPEPPPTPVINVPSLPTPEASPPPPQLPGPQTSLNVPTINSPPLVSPLPASGVVVTLVQSPSVQQTGLISVSVPERLATASSSFTFPLPTQLMVEAVADTPAQARLEDGNPLPAWLKFNPETSSFTVEAAPRGAFPIRVSVSIGSRKNTVLISERTD